jgi:predicted alpha/beta-fold hydrolase
MQRTAATLIDEGMRVVRMDLRACGRGEGLARRPYHAGCSDDVRAAVQFVHTIAPGSAVALIGFSLGGNIVLKFAAEAAKVPSLRIDRVAAVAPPIDLHLSSKLLSKPKNRLYELHFVRSLVAAVRRQRQVFPDLKAIHFPRKLTLRLFDDLYTAPASGFADADDYYRRAAAMPLISQIRVPAFIVAARDDPFVAVEPFEVLSRCSAIEVLLSDRGGHLGFLGWDGQGGIRWAERQVVSWVMDKPGSHVIL